MKAKSFALLLGTLLISLFGCSGKCDYEPTQPPTYPSKKFVISGRLLRSCDNPTPVPNEKLALVGESGYADNQKFVTTDSLGYFSFNGSSDFPKNKLYSDYDKRVDNLILNFLPSANANLGNVYLSSPASFTCIVRYSLSNSFFVEGDTLFLEYQLLHKDNKQKIYTSLASLAEPDTILIDKAKLNGFLHPVYNTGGSYNMTLKLRTKLLANAQIFKILNNCSKNEIVVPIP